jgi:hypothetical protein
MDGVVRPGDVVVCRINGTADCYVVGTVVAGQVGELSLDSISTTTGRDRAIEWGYRGQAERRPASRVWLFDGAAHAYVKTAAAPDSTAL